MAFESVGTSTNTDASSSTSEIWKEKLRLFSKSKSFMGGAILTLFVMIVTLATPLLAPHSPTEMDFIAILQGPSASHPFGTDDFGRDVMSRVLYGSRVSLKVGLQVTLITLVGGLIFGVLAGFYSRIDNILMRVMDLFMSFPAILLAIGVMAVLGPQLINVVIALAIVYTPRSTRIVRGAVIALKDQEYVEAARALGGSDWRMMTRHIVPSAVAPLVVQETFIFGYAILAEATLSFLGVGAPAGVPSWGNILSDGRNYLQVAPWMTFFPGLMLATAVLGVNLLGDGLRDLLDPRMKT